MSYSVKPVGHVVAFQGGYAAKVYRYGNGRLCPRRLLVADSDGYPVAFPSVVAALDALALWKTSPRQCRQLQPAFKDKGKHND